MRYTVFGCVAAASVLLSGAAMADAHMWKDGMMFTQEELTTLEGHKAVKIVFGLQPGKCAGEFTAPDEWLKMTIGIACEMDLVDAIDDLMHEPELTQTLCEKLNDIVRRAVLSFEPESDLDICTEMIEFEHH